MALKNIMNLGKAVGVVRNPTPLGVVDLGLTAVTGKGLAGHGMDILKHEMGRDKGTPPEVTITPTVRAMNEMEHITVQSASNGTDFGDLTVGRRGLGSGGSSEGDRACWGGGMNQNNNNHYNTIDYTSFSSPGNAGDFGDLTNTPQWSSGASGD